MKKLFTTALFSCLTCICFAQYTITINDVDFENGTITDYLNATEKNIIIPDNFDGEPVTHIGDYAFFNLQLTHVELPASITSIGGSAFKNNSLTTIDFPSTITEIGNESFFANQISTIDLPNSVTYLGEGAFFGSPATSYTIPNQPSVIWIISDINTAKVDYRNSGDVITDLQYGFQPGYTLTSDDVIFENGEIKGYLNTIEKDIIIPDNFEGIPVTKVAAGAFKNSSLTSVYMTNTITTIKDSAFFNNYLEVIRLSETIESIGSYAFNKNLLYNVTVPNSTYNIGKSAFSSNFFSEFNLPAAFENSVQTWFQYSNFEGVIGTYISGNAVSPEYAYFIDNGQVFEVTLHYSETVKRYYYLFATDETFVLPTTGKERVKFVGWYDNPEFNGDLYTEIPTGINQNIDLYPKFIVPSPYTLTIDDVEFENGVITDYLNLTEINIIIPDNFDGVPVTGIGANAFLRAGLINVDIPSSVTAIGEFAFSSNFLSEIHLPNSITAIERGTFWYNDFLEFNLPEHYQGYVYSWMQEESETLLFSGDLVYTEYVYQIGDLIEPYTFSISYQNVETPTTNPETYTVEDPTITLASASKEGYTFEGWYTNSEYVGDPITEIPTGTTGDIVLYAKFDEIITGLSNTHEKLSFYPNPSYNFIHVDANEPILIYSPDGTLRLTSEKEIIDISNLIPGLYILQQGEITATMVKE